MTRTIRESMSSKISLYLRLLGELERSQNVEQIDLEIFKMFMHTAIQKSEPLDTEVYWEDLWWLRRVLKAIAPEYFESSEWSDLVKVRTTELCTALDTVERASYDSTQTEWFARLDRSGNSNFRFEEIQNDILSPEDESNPGR